MQLVTAWSCPHREARCGTHCPLCEALRPPPITERGLIEDSEWLNNHSSWMVIAIRFKGPKDLTMSTWMIYDSL